MPQTPTNHGQATPLTHKHHKVKYYFDLVGIMFAVIGVFILVFQTRQMVKATQAAAAQAEVAQGQLTEMRRQNELDERPWLMPEKFAFWEGDSNVLRMTLKNIGKTPAFVKSIVISRWCSNEPSRDRASDVGS